MSEIYVNHSDLVTFTMGCYTKAGVAETGARRIAEILAELELRGISTHGVIRLPFYIRRLQQGGLNPKPNMVL